MKRSGGRGRQGQAALRAASGGRLSQKLFARRPDAGDAEHAAGVGSGGLRAAGAARAQGLGAGCDTGVGPLHLSGREKAPSRRARGWPCRARGSQSEAGKKHPTPRAEWGREGRSRTVVRA